MGKFVLIVLLTLTTIQVYAQEKPQFSQYMLNNYLLNPAVTGIENYTDLKAGYRSQWTGLNGAPVTSYLTINAPLGSKFIQGDAASASSADDNPSSQLLTRLYRSAEPHHGLGIMVMTDKTGPVTATTADLSYAYHIGLTARLNLALGISGGLSNLSLNRAELMLSNQNDPLLRSTVANQWRPDLGAGLWLYSPEFYVGLSALQLIPQNLLITGSGSMSSYKPLPSFYFTSGLKLSLNEDISFMPSFLIRKAGADLLTYDLNMKLAYRNRIYTGLSYRKNDTFAILLGLNINSLINIGYSYDTTLSTLNKVSNGSHEIVMGLYLNNRYGVKCPQRSF